MAWLVLADFAADPAWKSAKPVDASGMVTWNNGTTPLRTLTVTDPDPITSSPALFGNFSTGTPLTNPQVAEELSYLFISTRERPEALGEIIGQASEFLTYFMDLMSITPASHPATVRLMNIASLIGLYTAVYWKGVYKRVRPGQLCRR